jgi:transcriptional regulator GlxA family with amidase domain
MKRTIGAVFFDGFELLDIFGPLEMFGVLNAQFDITAVAETAGTVISAQQVAATATQTFAAAPQFDVLLVPGGMGTRTQAANPAMLDFLRRQAAAAEIVASICTGAGLLAAAGLLDGRRATTNKRAWAWPVSQGPKVTWVPQARWVEDGNVFTAAGVAAGIDMALAVIARLLGEAMAIRVADGTEYDWHRDANWDPFAAKNGLVPGGLAANR